MPKTKWKTRGGTSKGKKAGGDATTIFNDDMDDLSDQDVPSLYKSKGNYDSTSLTGGGGANMKMYTLRAIKNKDVEQGRELGSGTFGTVYKGKWRGVNVAVKIMKTTPLTGNGILSDDQQRRRLDFLQEAKILAELSHRNVVAFYGVIEDGPQGTAATVTEYLKDGSLRDVLLRMSRQFGHRQRLCIATDVAVGMEYLHRKKIVHFDLKAANILVNLANPSHPICKVGDLGLSKMKRDLIVSSNARGTLPWMAPELLNGNSNQVSEKVDVYSFGIVLWEILTGEIPYAAMDNKTIIGGVVNNKLRPPVPRSCNQEWRMLMEQCWAADAWARPSFTEIVGSLHYMSTVDHEFPEEEEEEEEEEEQVQVTVRERSFKFQSDSNKKKQQVDATFKGLNLGSEKKTGARGGHNNNQQDDAYKKYSAFDIYGIEASFSFSGQEHAKLDDGDLYKKHSAFDIYGIETSVSFVGQGPIKDLSR